MLCGIEAVTAVGFEPTHLSIVELESTPLDHSGTLPLLACFRKMPDQLRMTLSNSLD